MSTRLASGPILTHPFSAGSLANVGIKGPLASIGFYGALDLTFASRARGWVGSECQIRSTSLLFLTEGARQLVV